jgi:anti-sigma factor RsiW
MNEPTPLSDDEREELVAHLDGELDEARARVVEARLSLDPAARAEAEALNRAWEMLDYLPRPEPTEGFTHRTMERVSVVRSQQLARRAAWRRRRPWLVGAGWAAAVLALAAGGFLGMRQALTHGPTDEDLARDLRVLENKRSYEQVEDIGFLWKLSHPDLFGDDSEG